MTLGVLMGLNGSDLLHNLSDQWFWCLIVYCLCVQDEEQQQETGVTSSYKGCLKNPSAAWEVEGETAPQGESMGGRETSLLKTTDNLRTLSKQRRKGFDTVSLSLKPVGSPLESNREPDWVRQTYSMLTLWLQCQSREHLQLDSTVEHHETDERGQRQYREYRWKKISWTEDLASVCKIKDIHWSCRCHGQTVWSKRKQTPNSISKTGHYWKDFT